MIASFSHISEGDRDILRLLTLYVLKVYGPEMLRGMKEMFSHYVPTK